MKSHDPIFLMLLSLLMIIATATAVSAHPPSDLVLSYNPSTSELRATFTHMVANPATHYIGEVDIEAVGGGRILQMQYTSQPSNGTFTYTYPVNLANGTQVTVHGECNLGGEIRRTVEIGQLPVTSPTVPPMTTTIPTTTQTPGFSGLLSAFVLVALILYRFSRS